MKAAAIYARVSTADQVKGTSLDGQVDSCRQYAAQNDYTVIEAISEDISGARLDRPGLDSIREMAARGEIAAVIVWDVDRLSRMLAHQMLLMDEFTKRRVDVLFVNSPREDTAEGNMLFGMKGLFAEYERAKIHERTRLGKQRRAKQGRVVGTQLIAFGYRYIHGEGRLEIEESEAIWIRRIFSWLVDEGCSLRQIMYRLNTQGPTPRRAKLWGSSTVHSILSNTVYMGIFYWGRRQAIIPRNPKLEHRTVEKSSHIMRDLSECIPVPVPAIVSAEVFEAAQRQLGRNKEKSQRNVKHPYLLRGLLTCELCGYRYFGNTKRGTAYYRCGGRTIRGSVRTYCPTRALRADAIEPRVWAEVVHQLSDPEVLISNMEERQLNGNKERESLNSQLGVLYAADEVLKREDEKMLDLYARDVIELPQLQERLAITKKKRQAIDGEKARVLDQIDRLDTAAATREALESFCNAVRVGLPALTFEEKQAVLEAAGVQLRVASDGIHITGLVTDSILPLCERPVVYEKSTSTAPGQKTSKNSPESARCWLSG